MRDDVDRTGRTRARYRLRGAAMVALVVAATSACGSRGGDGTTTSSSRSTSAAASATPTSTVPTSTGGPIDLPTTTTSPPAPTTTYPPASPDATYVSIGDSYAQGYQPSSVGEPADRTKGFAYVLPGLAAARGYDLSLVNFGCSGATVGTLTDRAGCSEGARAPGGPPYPDRPQLQAAIDFLTAHPGQVQVVTVSIGGNDLTGCAQDADPVPCVVDGIADVDARLGPALQRLRAAAGPDTVIVGLTYPDVVLGFYLQDSYRELAELSVTAFKDLINPMLKKNYEAIGGIFVDVTAGTGAYTPLTETTRTEDHGTLPVAVAEVCRLTWSCEEFDIHPNDAGYRRIAELIAAALPPR